MRYKLKYYEAETERLRLDAENRRLTAENERLTTQNERLGRQNERLAQQNDQAAAQPAQVAQPAPQVQPAKPAGSGASSKRKPKYRKAPRGAPTVLSMLPPEKQELFRSYQRKISDKNKDSLTKEERLAAKEYNELAKATKEQRFAHDPNSDSLLADTPPPTH